MTQTVQVPVSLLVAFGATVQTLRDINANSDVIRFVGTVPRTEWIEAAKRATIELEKLK